MRRMNKILNTVYSVAHWTFRGIGVSIVYVLDKTYTVAHWTLRIIGAAIGYSIKTLAILLLTPFVIAPYIVISLVVNVGMCRTPKEYAREAGDTFYTVKCAYKDIWNL